MNGLLAHEVRKEILTELDAHNGSQPHALLVFGGPLRVRVSLGSRWVHESVNLTVPKPPAELLEDICAAARARPDALKRLAAAPPEPTPADAPTPSPSPEPKDAPPPVAVPAAAAVPAARAARGASGGRPTRRAVAAAAVAARAGTGRAGAAAAQPGGADLDTKIFIDSVQRCSARLAVYDLDLPEEGGGVLASLKLVQPSATCTFSGQGWQPCSLVGPRRLQWSATPRASTAPPNCVRFATRVRRGRSGCSTSARLLRRRRRTSISRKYDGSPRATRPPTSKGSSRARRAAPPRCKCGAWPTSGGAATLVAAPPQKRQRVAPAPSRSVRRAGAAPPPPIARRRRAARHGAARAAARGAAAAAPVDRRMPPRPSS